MSYVASQYNYATPLSSVVNLVGESSEVDDKKYFALSDNVLDGSYVPITGNVGLWSSAASGSDGTLSAPFVVTVTEIQTINAFRLTGSQYSYPVAFTVEFFNGNTSLYTITETANDSVEYIHYLPKTVEVTSYVITITKISEASSAARLYNIYNPAYVKRVDTLRVANVDLSNVYAIQELLRSDSLKLYSTDVKKVLDVAVASSDRLRLIESTSSNIHATVRATDSLKNKITGSTTVRNTIDVTRDALKLKHSQLSAIRNTIDVMHDRLPLNVRENISHVTNIIDVTRDRLTIRHLEDGLLTNVHTRMKDPSRHIYGKVYVTYTDPMLAGETEVLTSSSAYNSQIDQAFDSVVISDGKFFTLYENDLSGSYIISTEEDQVGWTSSQVSGEDSMFAEPYPFVRVNFAARPVISLSVTFDDSHDVVPEAFTIEYIQSNGNSVVKSFTDNKDYTVLVSDGVSDVVAVIVTV